ncbi:MAG: OsmC family protein [Bacteroidetes bacterium]|nr:OsmC family protein [Bacteroidota bacterium]
MKVSLKRIDDAFHFEGRNEDGRTVHYDAAEKIGGHNKGVRPMQTLLMSMAACSAIDVVSILKKQKQEIKSFEVEVEGEREHVKGAAVFTTVKAHFIFSGKIESEKAKRAVELSIEKYCSVAKTLRMAGAKVEYKVSVNEKKI